MKRRALILALAGGLLATACHGTATPSPGARLSAPALKLRVLRAVGGHIDWCDPDFYPVGIGTPLGHAREHIRAIRKDRPVLGAILTFERIPPGNPLTDAQLVTVYEDYKLVSGRDPIPLTPEGGGYRFAVIVPNNKSGYDDRIEGVVSPDGHVAINRRLRGGPTGDYEPGCPICLARGDLIATPFGPVPVQDVRVGMTVWSVDPKGHRIRAAVLRIGRTPVPPTHQVVRLALANGDTVLASPGHPTADGRVVGSLRPGDHLDGSTVVSATRILYTGRFTYDLLPSGPTGDYFANGILLGSTLRPT